MNFAATSSAKRSNTPSLDKVSVDVDPQAESIWFSQSHHERPVSTIGIIGKIFNLIGMADAMTNIHTDEQPIPYNTLKSVVKAIRNMAHDVYFSGSD